MVEDDPSIHLKYYSVPATSKPVAFFLRIRNSIKSNREDKYTRRTITRKGKKKFTSRCQWPKIAAVWGEMECEEFTRERFFVGRRNFTPEWIPANFFFAAASHALIILVCVQSDGRHYVWCWVQFVDFVCSLFRVFIRFYLFPLERKAKRKSCTNHLGKIQEWWVGEFWELFGSKWNSLRWAQV